MMEGLAFLPVPDLTNGIHLLRTLCPDDPPDMAVVNNILEEFPVSIFTFIWQERIYCSDCYILLFSVQKKQIPKFCVVTDNISPEINNLSVVYRYLCECRKKSHRKEGTVHEEGLGIGQSFQIVW
jgi:hypothetical protein